MEIEITIEERIILGIVLKEKIDKLKGEAERTKELFKQRPDLQDTELQESYKKHIDQLQGVLKKLNITLH